MTNLKYSWNIYQSAICLSRCSIAMKISSKRLALSVRSWRIRGASNTSSVMPTSSSPGSWKSCRLLATRATKTLPTCRSVFDLFDVYLSVATTFSLCKCHYWAQASCHDEGACVVVPTCHVWIGYFTDIKLLDIYVQVCSLRFPSSKSSWRILNHSQ